MGLIADIHKDLERGVVQLIVEYRGRLQSEAVGLCKDEALAEDLVFRTIERALTKIDTYKEDTNLFGWMRSIMVHIYQNDMKRLSARGTTVLEPDELEKRAGADWSTDEQLLKNSDSEAIRKALAGLDPKYNQVLLMRYYGEFTMSQIARVLQLPLGTVCRRMQIAHGLLAGKLGVMLGRTKKPLAVLAAALALVSAATAAVVAVPALAPVRDVVAAWFAEEDSSGTGDDSGTGVSPVQVAEADDGGTGVPPVQVDNDGGTGVPPVQEEAVSSTLTKQNTTTPQKEPTMNIKKIAAVAGATLVGWAASAYTDVPYVTTAVARQNWILLDYTPTNNTIIEATIEVPTSGMNQTKTIFCARGGSSATTTEENTMTCFVMNANEFRYDYSKKGTGAAQGGTVEANTKYVVTCDPAVGLTVNGERLGNATKVIPDFKAGNQLMLFASYTGARNTTPAATGNYSTFKVYRVRVWEESQTDDKLLFDLRPCMDENGVYCLRDAKNPEHPPYYSKGGGNFDGPMGELKVTVEDFGTCVPRISLTGMDVPDVTSVEFQSAPTANGPWTTFATVTAPEGEVFSADYADAVVSVPVYYRVTVNAASSIPLPAISFTRFRRLERDPANEKGGLVEGCSTPLEWGTGLPSNYTNGTYGCLKAFDGKPETFPDVSPFGRGDGMTKIGIDFGKEGAYVACVRALPRYNYTARLNDAKLYAADVEDFSDAVAVSPALSCSGAYTQADAMAGQVPFSVAYAQDTSVSHRFYYLYKASWYGNVAEMQLYGWTVQDRKQSGELIPPTSVSARLGSEVGSVVVSWTGGENIETCDLQRRVVGTEEWLQVASGLTGSTYTDTGLAIGQLYEYRLVVQGNGKTLAVAGKKPVYLYATGGGTGLRGVIYGPIACPSCRNNQTKQCAYHEFRTDATIDFNRQNSTEVLYASTNLTSGLVIWRGKLVVPMDGEYTIGIEVGTNDGYALTIDGTELGNRYTGNSAGRKAETVALTAGEHSIEVQWASRAYNGIRKCRLFWALEGMIAEEIIPASQLKPAADSELPVYFKDGLNFALPLAYGMYDRIWEFPGGWSSAPRLPYFNESSDGGTLQILADGPNLVTSFVSIFGRPVKGPFRAELTVRKGESDINCYPGLYVTGSSPAQQMIGFVVDPNNVSVILHPAHSPDVQMGAFGNWMKGNSTQTETKIRVIRDDEGTLHFLCRNAATNNKWVECYTFVGGTNCVAEGGAQATGLCTMTDKTLYVGFGGHGTKSVAHDLKIREGTPGFMLLLR